jgi:two-component system OmpR family response regulator
MSRTVDAHITELRRKLEDDPANPRYVVTVWKVGYRLAR